MSESTAISRQLHHSRGHDLEHWISHWLSVYFRIELEEAEALASKLKIFHPYGQIGRLPWQNSIYQKVGFGQNIDSRELLEISQQLRTFTERISDHQMVEDIRSEISAAETIVYLGFSYGEMNMQLLSMNKPGSRKRVIGTALGISPQNRDIIQQSIIRSVTHEGSIFWDSCSLEPDACNKLLDSYWRVLTS
ncbi:hypothetical protein [Rhizobium rhizogenes]|nr:hypothetical protein [Rhizobium rhizogenes]NTG66979.1 hypothetical protein [Rhizobium rhizogenes]NTI67843.1 hypothetical protein [Rhizobium rhizogenes]TRB14044.1 hypothetical protein EXN67_00005 [Rhizobium rhizogenes]TRB46834.1 hypothetical protein EXN73_00005 [Rhizobium rhizogenes]TRB64602.1 hypothetical protein EXN71_00005 [Rhizobium rhizogenes]